MLLRSKIAPKLQPNDFDSVLKVYEHFVLVKLNEIGQNRFKGAEQVAVAMKSLNQHSQQKQAAMVKDLLRKLKRERKAKKQP